MRRAAVGLFICYPLLPFAFFCGLGLFDGRAYGMLAVLYYMLLLSSLWGCRRFGGMVGFWYMLAFAITWGHMAGVGAVLLGKFWKVPYNAQDSFFGLILLSILGVYLAASCAGSALAFRQNRPIQGLAQLVSPGLLLASCAFGGLGLILVFGGQAMHALWLSFLLVNQNEEEDLRTIGFSPEE